MFRRVAGGESYTAISRDLNERGISTNFNGKWQPQRIIGMIGNEKYTGKVYMPYKQFLGYKRGEDGTPQIVEEEAATVRKIYDMFLQGDSIYRIANKLQAEGIKTPAGKENWCRSVLRSILTNEKYKGCALLQKSYTIDFLTKKQVKNRGEVSQYYVEDSHPVIIEPEKWEMVQREMARRQESGPHYSGCSLFSSRIICGDCGGFYGPRIYNANTKYRHIVWRCNHKYVSEGRKEGKCETPGLKEDLIKCMFLEAVNEVIENRTEILNECRRLWKTYTKRSAMDEKIDALEKECGLIGETIRELVEKTQRLRLIRSLSRRNTTHAPRNTRKRTPGLKS